MNSLLIYTEQITNRLKYIFDLMLTDLLGLEYEITSDLQKFSNHTHAKFSYASAPVSDEIFFEAVPLLFETDIQPHHISFCIHENITGFHPVSERSVIPCDMFASAFFMVTRYEEYLPHKSDKYSRYRASQSMNYKGDILEKPMVNYYALEIKKILSVKYPQLIFKIPAFEYIPTFDVDMAYSYLHKGFTRNLGGFVRSLFLSDFKEAKERANVLLRKQKDPFDTFDYICDVCRAYNLKSIFFFLLGNESSFDKNIPHTIESFRTLIKNIAAETETGIHFSFKSHVATENLQEELSRLEEITGKKTCRNRFHYLRFHIPNTFLRIQKLGIQEDYSMGYASRVGFRAGITTPYTLFNLKTNTNTGFKIFPFAFMDTTFAHYLQLEPDEALQKIMQMMKYVHETGGTFYGLWHNSSFIEQKEWNGWKNVFETVAQEASILMKEEK